MRFTDGAAWDPADCTGSSLCPPRCPRFVDARGVPLVVRPCRADDLQAVVAMYDALDPSVRTLGLPPASRDRIHEWVASLVAEGWNLVALDDGRVVGHLGVAPAAARAPEVVLFVSDDCRGRGIGTELLYQGIAYAAESGYDALRLVVSRGNRRARAVFRTVGFELDERTPGELEMRLDLDSPVADRARLPPADR